MYYHTIAYLALQGYAAVESIDLVAYLYKRDAKQVLHDIDETRRVEHGSSEVALLRHEMDCMGGM